MEVERKIEMETKITWFKPNEKTPPFDEQILVLLGGQGSNDAGRTFQRYVKVANVVMLEESINDEESGSEYQAFQDDERGPGCFDDYQFFLIEYSDHTYGDETNVLDWHSDAIVAWAPMPDLSEVMDGII